MVDAGDSKSPAARRAGSIPAPGTRDYEAEKAAPCFFGYFFFAATDPCGRRPPSIACNGHAARFVPRLHRIARLPACPQSTPRRAGREGSCAFFAAMRESCAQLHPKTISPEAGVPSPVLHQRPDRPPAHGPSGSGDHQIFLQFPLCRTALAPPSRTHFEAPAPPRCKPPITPFSTHKKATQGWLSFPQTNWTTLWIIGEHQVNETSKCLHSQGTS